MTNRNFIQIGTRKLSYQQWGDVANEKVLMCVHGLSRNSHDFDYLAKVMSPHYRVIAVDVAGRGQSDWLTDKKQYNYQTYVGDMLALVDNLGIKKVDWVGTSMGGIIAMLLFAQRPTLINKLVLNDIGPLISGIALDRIIKYVTIAPVFDMREEAEAAIKTRMQTFGIKNPEHWQHVTQHSVEAIGDKFRFAYDPAIIKKPSCIFTFLSNIRHPSKWRSMPDINLWPFWQKVTCPVLVIRGAVSDILSAETVAKMKEGRSNVTVVELPDVGHAPMLLEDEQIKIVKDWLLA
jgi:pimeloyl-ACP methyl ester carboxylesterase